jgi:hypothetical protein
VDFGEYLIDVRERLEVPLPLRVQPWRVFLASSVETYCMGSLVIIRRDYRPFVVPPNGLSTPHIDLGVVVQEFDTLKGLTASPEQIEQARTAFHEQVNRRCQRLDRELTLWVSAAQSGTFLGMLFFGLLLACLCMSVMNGHSLLIIVISLTYVVSQIVAVIICLKGWLRL